MLPTKILKDFIAAEKREEKIRIMLGVLEGKVLQPAELAAVAKLPKKEVLISMLLSAMQGPIRGVVYTLNAVLTKFVRVIAAIQDKRKGEGDMSATATKLSQEELIKAIESMSVLDLAELVKGLRAASESRPPLPSPLPRRLPPVELLLLRPKRRRRLTSFSRLPRPTRRFRSSRWFVNSRAWDSRKPKIWSRALRSPSRRARPRKSPMP